MSLSNSRLSRSYSDPMVDKGEFALRAATAFLITFAVALVLIRACAWGEVLLDQTGIPPLF